MHSLITFLFGCTLCAMLKAIGIDPVSDVFVFVLIVVFAIAFIEDVQRSQRFEKYSQALVLGFVFRVVLLLFDRYGRSIYHLPNSGADSEAFYNLAVAQAQGHAIVKHGGFAGLFEIIFSILGTNRLFGQFIVLLFSIVALIIITATIDEFSIDDKQKIRAISIIALLPNYAILSSIFLRESIVSMFVTASFYCFMQFYKRKSFLCFVLSYVSVVAGMVFHSGVAGLLIGYTFIILIHESGTDKNRLGILNIILASITVAISLYLYVNYGETFFTKFLKLNTISDVANTLSEGGSTYGQYVGNSDSFFNVFKYTIPRYVYFLFSPFPWQWRGISDIIAFCFSGLYYLWIILLSIHYIMSCKSINRTLVINIMIIIICSVFAFAWGVSNTGTAVRHRDKLITIFAAIHALCCDPSKGLHVTIGDWEII